jgi:hypothetical protein
MAMSARVVRLQYEGMKDKYGTRWQAAAPRGTEPRGLVSPSEGVR